MDYRQQYYDRYVSVQVQPKRGMVTEQGYASWADAMMAHLGGWLAEDLTTPILDVG